MRRCCWLRDDARTRFTMSRNPVGNRTSKVYSLPNVTYYYYGDRKAAIARPKAKPHARQLEIHTREMPTTVGD